MPKKYLVCIYSKHKSLFYKKRNFMCYSATLSFFATAVLTAIGIASIKKAQSYSALYYFALLPFLFAAQQLGEGIVWLGFSQNNQMLITIGSLAFLFFAFIVWPIWIPLSLYKMEDHSLRKNILLSLCIIGGCFDILVLIWGCCALNTKIVGHHIQYYMPGIEPYYIPVALLYCIATIIPFFVASYYLFWLFGLTLAFSLLATTLFYYQTIISIWCFFAAALSIFVWFIIRNLIRDHYHS